MELSNPEHIFFIKKEIYNLLSYHSCLDNSNHQTYKNINTQNILHLFTKIKNLSEQDINYFQFAFSSLSLFQEGLSNYGDKIGPEVEPQVENFDMCSYFEEFLEISDVESLSSRLQIVLTLMNSNNSSYIPLISSSHLDKVEKYIQSLSVFEGSFSNSKISNDSPPGTKTDVNVLFCTFLCFIYINLIKQANIGLMRRKKLRITNPRKHSYSSKQNSDTETIPLQPHKRLCTPIINNNNQHNTVSSTITSSSPPPQSPKSHSLSNNAQNSHESTSEEVKDVSTLSTDSLKLTDENKKYTSTRSDTHEITNMNSTSSTENRSKFINSYNIENSNIMTGNSSTIKSDIRDTKSEDNTKLESTLEEYKGVSNDLVDESGEVIEDFSTTFTKKEDVLKDKLMTGIKEVEWEAIMQSLDKAEMEIVSWVEGIEWGIDMEIEIENKVREWEIIEAENRVHEEEIRLRRSGWFEKFEMKVKICIEELIWNVLQAIEYGLTSRLKSSIDDIKADKGDINTRKQMMNTIRELLEWIGVLLHNIKLRISNNLIQQFDNDLNKFFTHVKSKITPLLALQENTPSTHVSLIQMLLPYGVKSVLTTTEVKSTPFINTNKPHFKTHNNNNNVISTASFHNNDAMHTFNASSNIIANNASYNSQFNSTFNTNKTGPVGYIEKELVRHKKEDVENTKEDRYESMLKGRENRLCGLKGLLKSLKHNDDLISHKASFMMFIEEINDISSFVRDKNIACEKKIYTNLDDNLHNATSKLLTELDNYLHTRANEQKKNIVMHIGTICVQNIKPLCMKISKSISTEAVDMITKEFNNIGWPNAYNVNLTEAQFDKFTSQISDKLHLHIDHIETSYGQQTHTYRKSLIKALQDTWAQRDQNTFNKFQQKSRQKMIQIITQLNELKTKQFQHVYKLESIPQITWNHLQPFLPTQLTHINTPTTHNHLHNHTHTHLISHNSSISQLLNSYLKNHKETIIQQITQSQDKNGAFHYNNKNTHAQHTFTSIAILYLIGHLQHMPAQSIQSLLNWLGTRQTINGGMCSEDGEEGDVYSTYYVLLTLKLLSVSLHDYMNIKLLKKYLLACQCTYGGFTPLAKTHFTYSTNADNKNKINNNNTQAENFEERSIKQNFQKQNSTKCTQRINNTYSETQNDTHNDNTIEIENKNHTCNTDTATSKNTQSYIKYDDEYDFSINLPKSHLCVKYDNPLINNLFSSSTSQENVYIPNLLCTYYCLSSLCLLENETTPYKSILDYHIETYKNIESKIPVSHKKYESRNVLQEIHPLFNIPLKYLKNIQ